MHVGPMQKDIVLIDIGLKDAFGLQTFHRKSFGQHALSITDFWLSDIRPTDIIGI